MKRLVKVLGWFFLIVIAGTWFYTNSLIGVDKQVKNYYRVLKKEIKEVGYKPSVFVISGRRWKWDNDLLSKFGGAAKNSRHKLGEAIDIIVLDINQDGKSDARDVDIVYEILDRQIIKDKGGLGTYKNENGFFNRQMVHFDCRGYKARWHR
ncbi:MAG: hypothetical protein AAFO07_30695 [Bacteroidota bacterium]